LAEFSMRDGTTSATVWWSARRLRYNIALLVAGLLAFVAYVVLGHTILPDDAEFEVTIFTMVFQGVGFLLAMGLANLLYFVGPLSERILRPRDPER
jgi:hypothetical protein